MPPKMCPLGNMGGKKMMLETEEDGVACVPLTAGIWLVGTGLAVHVWPEAFGELKELAILGETWLNMLSILTADEAVVNCTLGPDFEEATEVTVQLLVTALFDNCPVFEDIVASPATATDALVKEGCNCGSVLAADNTTDDDGCVTMGLEAEEFAIADNNDACKKAADGTSLPGSCLTVGMGEPPTPALTPTFGSPGIRLVFPNDCGRSIGMF